MAGSRFDTEISLERGIYSVIEQYVDVRRFRRGHYYQRNDGKQRLLYKNSGKDDFICIGSLYSHFRSFIMISKHMQSLTH